MCHVIKINHTFVLLLSPNAYEKFFIPNAILFMYSICSKVNFVLISIVEELLNEIIQFENQLF